jgi:hypothetical protein
MRATIIGTRANCEVIGELVTIEGSSDQFLVHRSLSNNEYDKLWQITHLPTSFAFGYGNTPDEAIAHGRMRWAARSPEELQAALIKASSETEARISRRKLCYQKVPA